MRKFLFFLMASIIALGAAAKGSGYMHYKGTIGPYEITMKIKVVDGYRSQAAGRYIDIYEGSYTYVKAGNTLKLSGHESMFHGDYEFEETTPKGRVSATWFLHSDDDMDHLTGTMTLTKNGKEFPVKLHLVK